MKKLIYTLTAFVITHSTFSIGEASAQSWQWAKRGGGKTYSGTPDEEFRSMALDRNGNTYSLARVHTDKISGDVDVDGNKLGKGNGSFDIALVSFDCSGKYRWSKIIGSRLSDNAYTVKTDTLGGVYVTGNFVISPLGDSVFFAGDTSFGTTVSSSKKFYQSLFLVKYDTSGNYKWLRMPEPDTLSGPRTSASFSMDISPDGITSILGYIGSSGTFANGAYVIPTSSTFPSMHMLKYDRNGNFIKGFPISISEGDYITLSKLRMVWDVKSDVYYILFTDGGDPTITKHLKFGTVIMSKSIGLGKFSNSGADLWVKQSTGTGYVGAAASTPVIDGTGNVYFASSDIGGSTFLGYTVVNKLAGSSVPVVFKVSPPGSLLWGKSGSASSNAKGLGIAVSHTKDEVAFIGGYLGKLYWGSDSLYANPDNAYFIRLKTTDGATISIDSTTGGGTEWPGVIATDKRGNYYIGGYFTSSLKVGSLPSLSKYGGDTDFFILKYGESDCSTPVSISEQIPAYATVKIYPNPANDKLTLEGAEKGTDITLIDILGRQVYSGKIESAVHQIALNGLAEGMYLLQLQAGDGAVYSTKIMKQ